MGGGLDGAQRMMIEKQDAAFRGQPEAAILLDDILHFAAREPFSIKLLVPLAAPLDHDAIIFRAEPECARRIEE